MIQVSALYVYPIKSLAGIAVSDATITDRGFQYDRRWMLVDSNGRFLSQREHPAMALLQVELHGQGLLVYHKQHHEKLLIIPYDPGTDERLTVTIWGETCDATLVSKVADEWFSAALHTACRLVYMPDECRVPIEPEYALPGELTSFSDGYPILMISVSSLADLNSRSSEAVPMDRFRPNLVISGASAYEENQMAAFNINGINFYGVKPSARCVVTTINQDTAVQQKEPLKTLARYRSVNNKVYFGENVIARDTGRIQVGDPVQITATKTSIVPIT